MPFLEKQIQQLKKEKYHDTEPEGFRADVLRLENGEPYEYVLGYVDFLGAHIDLSYRPMIPRPETAFWVQRAIKELNQIKGPIRIADTFAGAGNVALAVLTQIPRVIADISELDPNLKAQIELNLSKNNIAPERARVITASALDGLVGEYDSILAVPPYVPYDALPDLDPEMINHEPHLAFFAHNNGHEFHEILIKNAWPLLKKGGVLYMEADMDHENDI